ncbi:Ferrochelatase, protoheme ferro-lyase [hydrothermal vent metagenome]|uniref:Ferrochelatase, protoheme ferro-lyase n=1 Tax=hydrothermal vent metagenome TaxID=652676 RepID=A0A3B1BXL3_9ZZZZ
MPFQNHPKITKDTPEHLGVLLVNLGTPNSPSVTDVRRYLKEFLSDPRVVETPRLLWWFILNGIILRTRPKRSAAAYAKVWTDQGSPLMQTSMLQAEALQKSLDGKIDQPIKVALAMRYGNPSIAAGLNRLRQTNAQRVIVLPLYPQYSAATTASIFDAVTTELQSWRRIPELQFVNHYQDDPGYIQALAQSVRTAWEEWGRPERLLMSFHGIPQDYADGGDPYPEECHTTASMLATELGLARDQWEISFQSRMGSKEWIKPYTDETLKAWGRKGVKKVHVICPGFPTDCLETLEEIAIENCGYFTAAGGEKYQYIPALNTAPNHIKFLAELILRHASPLSSGITHPSV